MREVKEPINFLEEDYNSKSCYSKDGKHVYSIPEDGSIYELRNGCITLELKGRLSMIQELILPASFRSFDLESISCLPSLKKITAYSEFHFVSESLIKHDVSEYWRNTNLEEISVLPWLIDIFKKRFGYCAGYRDAIIKVSAIPNDIAYRFTKEHDCGFITSMDGKTLVKVNKTNRVLEIPLEIERIASSAFDEDNMIETLIIKGNSEDSSKGRWQLDFHKDAVNTLAKTKTLIFECPMYTSFYNDTLTGAEMSSLKTIIFPLWNYDHYCFRGSFAEGGERRYIIKAENFSSIELIEEDGIVYSKDGKYLVSGVDCKSKRIHIRNGVEEIFQYAFCANLSLEEVYLPRTVIKVGVNAFKSCKNIKKIIYNVHETDSNSFKAFYTYSRNIHFYLPETDFSNRIKDLYEITQSNLKSKGFWPITQKMFEDNPVDVEVHTLPYYPGEVTIDETTGMVYDEKGRIFVGVLKERASVIINLSLPDHVKNIFEFAFSNLSEVENINVPNGQSALRIFEIAKSCSKLKSIAIDGVVQIIIEDGIAYSRDYKEIIGALSTTTIPSFNCKEGIESISAHAFEGHGELTNFQFSQTIKTVRERAFANTGIKEIILPTSLAIIGKEAFAFCDLSIVHYEGPIADGGEAFDKASFDHAAVIKMQKIYKESFIMKYPNLKGYVKTPLPKWLSWLGNFFHTLN